MNVDQYIESIDATRQPFFVALRNVILDNLPKGFAEVIQYGMISYVVPHSIYPAGYHCKPSDPLPFMSIAAQKNSINFYHMGLYARKDLMASFASEYQAISKHKIDMGKSCLRFKYYEEIPYGLIKQLAAKITVDEWISLYEDNYRRNAKK